MISRSFEEWSIKSIRLRDDGSWIACLENENYGYDRVSSEDGFYWKTKHRVDVPPEVQDELTRCVGCMLDQNIRHVAF